MTITAEMKRSIPDALYSCETFECSSEVSYPASMLHWHPRDECFYCEGCHDGERIEEDPRWSDEACPSLAEVLAVP